MRIRDWIAKHQVSYDWMHQFLHSKEPFQFSKSHNTEELVHIRLNRLESESPPSPILGLMKNTWSQKLSKERLGKVQTTFTSTKEIKGKLNRLSKVLKTRSQSDTVGVLIDEAYARLVLEQKTAREVQAEKKAQKKAAMDQEGIKSHGIHSVQVETHKTKILELKDQLEQALKANEGLVSEIQRLSAVTTSLACEPAEQFTQDNPTADSACLDDEATHIDEPPPRSVTVSIKPRLNIQPRKKFTIN